MRPVERIGPMLALVERIWRTHPDLRLGQLILNVVPKWQEFTLYNLEDEVLEQRLRALYEKTPVKAGG